MFVLSVPSPRAIPDQTTLTCPRATTTTIPQRVEQHYRDDRAVKHKTSQPQCPVSPVIAHSVWEAIRTVGDIQRAACLCTAAGIEVAGWMRVLRFLLEKGSEARHDACCLARWSLLHGMERADASEGTSEEWE